MARCYASRSRSPRNVSVHKALGILRPLYTNVDWQASGANIMIHHCSARYLPCWGYVTSGELSLEPCITFCSSDTSPC
jgi:hypothetical protein